MPDRVQPPVLLDVERWDQPHDGLEPFNGQLDGVSLDDLTRPGLNPDQVSRYAAQVIGVGNVPLRALASLPLINREIVGRPQVASTASTAAGLAMTPEITPEGAVRLALPDPGPGSGSGSGSSPGSSPASDPDPGSGPELASLFPALISRVTDKRGYPPDAVEPPRLPDSEGIAVAYVTDPASRAHLADLHRQAVAELARTGAFARELAGWLRTDPADPRRDGMTLPLPPDAAESLIAALSRSGGPLLQMGERDAQALATGPLLGLLTSAEDTEAAWIRAGLAWQRLSLAAHADGLATAPLTAVVENPRTRQAAAALAPPGQHLRPSRQHPLSAPHHARQSLQPRNPHPTRAGSPAGNWWSARTGRAASPASRCGRTARPNCAAGSAAKSWPAGTAWTPTTGNGGRGPR